MVYVLHSLSNIVKKIIIYLNIILAILAFNANNALSQVKFYDGLTPRILNQINTFRSSPLSYLDSLGIGAEQIQSIWGEGGLAYLSLGLPLLSLDQSLTIAAKVHLEDMFNNGYISHLSQDGLTPEERAAQSEYNALLIGESIAFLCFENYIPPAQAANILLRQLFQDALLQQTAEGAPLVFAPYEDIGIVLAGSTFKIEGKTYNVYALCIEFGLPTTSSQNLLVGRVYLTDGNTKPSPNSGIKGVELNFYNIQGKMFAKTFSFPDGTFFIPKPSNEQYVYVYMHVPNGKKEPLLGKLLTAGLQRVDLSYQSDWLNLTNNGQD